MTEFVLDRHGQTEWNRAERFRGRADVPLDATGLAQAQATGQRVAEGWRPAAVYSSPLSQALRTAEAVAAPHGLPVRACPALLDIDYGLWQGLTTEDALARWPEQVEAWFKAPQTARIPEGESLEAVRTRAMAEVTPLAHRHVRQTVVLVAHTVVNRALLLGILGLGLERFWRLRQEPCALNLFEWDGADFVLASLNDTCHLRGLV